MLAEQQLAEWDSQRRCDRRQDAFVGKLAGLETLDRARENLSLSSQVVDAVALRDPEAKEACR